MTAQVTPSLDEFLALAKHGNVIPVFAELVGDCETPVSAFKKFSRCAYSFLFESTEKNDVSGRFSFVGFEPRIIIQSLWRGINLFRPRSSHGSLAAPSVFSATKRFNSSNRKFRRRVRTTCNYPRC